MGASAPSGRSAAGIRRQMQTESGGRDPNAMGGFRNAPLRQEERRPQAGVQDARDKIRDSEDRRETFERVAERRKSMDMERAMQGMMKKKAEDEIGGMPPPPPRDVQAGGPGGYFRGRGPFQFGADNEIGGMPPPPPRDVQAGGPGGYFRGSGPSASFEPNPGADLSTPGGPQYGDMGRVIGRMRKEKEGARKRADARQSAFAQYAASMAQNPTDNQFGGANVLAGYQPSQGFGAYMSQMQTPDSRSQSQFRDRFLGMADMRNAMGGEEQQRRFRAQQFRPEYGQQNVGRMKFANDPETLPPGTF
jgi:hypothetical protein